MLPVPAPQMLGRSHRCAPKIPLTACMPSAPLRSTPTLCRVPSKSIRDFPRLRADATIPKAASTDDVVVAVVTQQQNAPAQTQNDSGLPFAVATARFQQLIEEASWDTEEELKYEISSYNPEMKLTLFTNVGSLLTLISFGISWMCGEDPVGGMSLTGRTLDAALEGAGYALPLVLCSIATRIGPVSTKFPVLEDLRDSQRELVEPIVSDLNPSQLLIMASVLVVPSLLLLLPAMHGALMVLAQIMSADLLQPMGLHMPRMLAREASVLLPAVLSAYVAAWFATRQLRVKDRQFQAIRDAVSNADRYFLLHTAERMAERPNEHCSQQLSRQSQQASEAFKAVAIIWLLTKRKAAQLGYVLTALNISYFGIIWHQTDDLATPVAAAMIATLAELAMIQYGAHRRAAGREAAAARNSGSQ